MATTAEASPQIIVIGGGLSGLSAAHTVLQAGGRVLVLDRNAFLGGNSTKATSGINGGGTMTQALQGVQDFKEIFEEDTIRSATGIKKGPCPPPFVLGKVLTHNSASGIEWLQQRFGLALDVVSRLGGASNPRTHRSGGGSTFPGMEITYSLMVAIDDIAKANPNKARVICKARVQKLEKNEQNEIIGVTFTKGGQTYTEWGPVVVATGGYGAGVLEKTSFLNKVRPDLMHLSTTNGSHCQGDGIHFTLDAGGSAVDLKSVQVHPTGLVHPEDPDNKVKFLAAEALRGEGGILLDRHGNRFCDDLGTRDYVSGMMFKNQGPFRLVLNSKAAAGIDWHCRHYTGRGVMKNIKSGAALAKEMGVPLSALEKTFSDYNGFAAHRNDPWGKRFFPALPLKTDDSFYVAVVTPVVHYTMGGLRINENAEVMIEGSSQSLKGVFAAGEVTGGVHGLNRLGGSALLECVVFGRVAGASANRHLKSGRYHGPNTPAVAVAESGGLEGASAMVEAGAPKKASKVFTLDEVAKHKKDTDCWVVVNGEVLDVTTFLDDHPGGKMAIMTFAGKDATEEFNMLHEKNVVEKFAPETIIGTLALSSKL